MATEKDITWRGSALRDCPRGPAGSIEAAVINAEKVSREIVTEALANFRAELSLVK